MTTPEERTLPSEVPISPPRRRPWRKKWVILAGIALTVCIFDQLSKHWAQQDLQFREGRRISLISDYFHFTYVRNPGAAWGFLSRWNHAYRRPFFVGISILAMIFISHLFLRLEPGQTVMLWALSLVMGGAMGNLIDRLRFNYVIDFIDVHYQDKFKWPTFNVADIAITLGVILMFIEMFFCSKNPKTVPSPSLHKRPDPESKPHDSKKEIPSPKAPSPLSDKDAA